MSPIVFRYLKMVFAVVTASRCQLKFEKKREKTVGGVKRTTKETKEISYKMLDEIWPIIEEQILGDSPDAKQVSSFLFGSTPV